MTNGSSMADERRLKLKNNKAEEAAGQCALAVTADWWAA